MPVVGEISYTATGSAVGSGPYAWEPGSGELIGKRVTQCALSRICGNCAEPLSRPVAFLGTAVEEGRNAFHNPPLHTECVDRVRASDVADPAWVVVLTSGFEFVRAGREDVDRRPTFQPNSRL